MADILIRGMEMPENCSLCKLAQHRMFTGSVMCPITGQTVGYYNEGFHQEDHICPLVPLPEGHGRLIDASEAYDKISEQECGYYMDMDGVGAGLDECRTIVLAEGGTDNG